ncbi:MAG: lipoate--protein ligase [Firmicutes bacterium]|nr:lipoate--protein ligase [Bacillota bacterium]
MIKVVNENTDPRINLAVEEYAINYLDPSQDYAILWQNEPAVIVGRNQNTIAEVNAPYIKEHGIHVVRRLSGGGAVYHDFGNLNFTFIVDAQKSVVSNFEYFTKPVIDALAYLGVKAEFTGRNDITINGQKFSGNAQYWSKNRLLHHGTIMFNSDLSVVQEALNVKADKIQSKGVKSVRSRVTNILPHLPKPVTIEEFKETLWRFLIPDSAKKEDVLTEEDWAIIRDLKDRRYNLWDWNYGASPESDVEKEERFAGGKLELKFNVTDGVIQDMNIFGDFFGRNNVHQFAKLLNGHDYRENVIAELLETVEFEDYFIGITRDDFLHCLFS